jgi:hypothetical protein
MLFDRRIILVLPALVALSLEYAGAFTPVVLGGGKASPSSSHHQAASSRLLSSALASSETTEAVDLSIPYDAAARLAYSAWCTKFSKPTDEARYVSFKANYETITVANVIAIKEYIDAGGDIVGGSGNDRPKDLELNEYGDMTEEEYVAMMAAGGGEAEATEVVVTTTEKGPLETFMEASEAQSEASIALAEAADALAEEEEVRSPLLLFIGPPRSYLPPKGLSFLLPLPALFTNETYPLIARPQCALYPPPSYVSFHPIHHDGPTLQRPRR